ncbi:hypothetical protein HMSSN036_03260 [Paenibacillus macerans]|nr:hypothetical protein HMSSN036_03260 [Paenibacillus macerans]
MAYVSDKNAIPIMTSNIAPSGVASASNSVSEAYCAFDGNNSTNWGNSNGVYNEWLRYKFDTPKQIVRYSLTNHSSITTSPKNWRFEASNDGLTWIVLDEQAATWSSQTTKTYSFINNNYYTFYRIYVISSQNTGVSRIWINELRMYELIL